MQLSYCTYVCTCNSSVDVKFVRSWALYNLQEEGTFHFRTTILVQEKDTDEVANRLVKFHNNFFAKYGEPEQ